MIGREASLLFPELQLPLSEQDVQITLQTENRVCLGCSAPFAAETCLQSDQSDAAWLFHYQYISEKIKSVLWQFCLPQYKHNYVLVRIARAAGELRS